MPKLILRFAPLASDAAPRHVVDLSGNGRATAPAAATTPLARWSATVAAAHDACLVLDAEANVLSLSAAAAELLGCADGRVVGRALLDVVHVVDFDTGTARPDYASRIAPVAVLGQGHGLMRSLLRVRHADATTVTIDASSAPLHDAHGEVMGSITFLARVRG